MKLDPVYVVSPAKGRDGRRRLPRFAGVLLLGLTLGLPIGFALGGLPLPQRDPMREWLRYMADDSTPVDVLLHNHATFLAKLAADYKDDQLLWHGVERLAAAVLEDDHLPQPQRKEIAGQLVQTLDIEGAPAGLAVLGLAGPLRAIGK